MDALRLLSRGTKRRRDTQPTKPLPSGQEANPQLFASLDNSKKRKRNPIEQSRPTTAGSQQLENNDGTKRKVIEESAEDVSDFLAASALVAGTRRPLDDRKKLFREHKLKINVITESAVGLKVRPNNKRLKTYLYPDPTLAFDELTEDPYVPDWLVRNLHEAGFDQTTEVQMAAIALRLHSNQVMKDDGLIIDLSDTDLLTVAPTGSGKTLAFLVPTVVDIVKWQAEGKARPKQVVSLILAPTKELVDQIVNEGRRIMLGSGLKISQYRKGMSLNGHKDRDETKNHDSDTAGPLVKFDILVSTPGLLSNALELADADTELCSTVRHLILDEADVLLDPLFREQTVSIWQKLSNQELSVSLWSATMGSNIEELSQSIIQQRRNSIRSSTSHEVPIRPLVRMVVGLKDSAVPNVEHKLIYAATEQGKLMGLRQLLHPATASVDSQPALRPPFIIFTQTIERAIALHSELLYDIPAEAGGISRIAVLHSDLSDTAREKIMTRFRRGEAWVLITTDLLSRGIDFRGVNGVVNYDIPSSSAAYVHRVGRTGRAGREGGVAVTLYSREDIPYLKHIANVVAAAQREKGVVGDSGVQKWLLDALPTLSKNDKQHLKKHGVEVRTARGMAKDAKAARRARISTKAGYDRREENRKKQAVEASRKRRDPAVMSLPAEDFAGFD